MTAQLVTRFGTPIPDDLATGLSARTLTHLRRPIRHHRNGFGSLWERVAEGKTR